MTTDTITSFRGPYRFLSNFHPCQIRYQGVNYPSVEHAYQAAKTDIQGERVQFENPTLSAGVAKKLGRRVTLQPGWDAKKINVMRELLAYKFFHHTELATDLASTVDAELIEGNTWGDDFWGVCDGVGENWLGILLMEVREAIKKGTT